jgi:hypothetical protein
MRKGIIGVVIFLCGFILGIFCCLFLSMQAASSYADSIRINYQLEQHIMAVKAKAKDDMVAAIAHYKNIVDTSSSAVGSFDNSKKIWTFSYPFLAGINKYLGVGQIERSEASEGIYRALMSDALERHGNIAEANIELRKASMLLGCNGDIMKAKEILKGVLKSERELGGL